MTRHEAEELRVGDLVRPTNTKDVWEVVYIACRLEQRPLNPRKVFWVTITTFDPRQIKKVEFRVYKSQHLVLVKKASDGVMPNVYADFLEEHGEQTAADLLRKAFPME
jgi:hypothetical protein